MSRASQLTGVFDWTLQFLEDDGPSVPAPMGGERDPVIMRPGVKHTWWQRVRVMPAVLCSQVSLPGMSAAERTTT